MSSRDEVVKRARAVADAVRTIAPDTAAEIDRRVAEIEAGRLDRLDLDVKYTLTLEKFDGDKQPGQSPAEVVVREGRL